MTQIVPVFFNMALSDPLKSATPVTGVTAKGKRRQKKKKLSVVNVGLGFCENWLGAIELDVTKNYVSL